MFIVRETKAGNPERARWAHLPIRAQDSLYIPHGRCWRCDKIPYYGGIVYSSLKLTLHVEGFGRIRRTSIISRTAYQEYQCIF